MKILLAVHHFPPNYRAGAELQAFRTARALLDRGHDVRVVTVESVQDQDSAPLRWIDDDYEGVPVRRLFMDLAKCPHPDRFEYDNSWIGDHIRAMLEVERPDLFFLYSGYLITVAPLLAAVALGIPVAVTLTEFWFLCRRLTMLQPSGAISTVPVDPAACARCLAESRRRYRLPGKAAPRLMHAFWHLQKGRVEESARRQTTLSAALAQADLIISQSHFVHEMFVASGAPTDKMVFCRQGQLTTDSEPAVNQKVASDVLRLTYMGQIAQHKGLHVLVDALNEIPDAPVSLEIYGDTAVNPDYVRSLMEISRNDKRIRFAGTFSRNELTGIMNRTDAVVVPSLWYENSPNVIFEAFAHQVPVVATDLGGMAELVQSGKNGLLFPVGDSAALAQAIQTLVDAPGLLAEMAKHVPTVRSVKQEIDELEALFLDLVARRQSATNRPVEREGLAP